jgi:hypothetical protein
MQTKADAELDGDLAMELVEVKQGHETAAVEAVKIIREMIRREIQKAKEGQ